MKELIFKDPRDYIQFEFEMRRSRRPAYSMRAFARDLNVSPSSLNDFMKGRIGMSKNRVMQIAESLKWSNLRQEHFLDLISAKYGLEAGERQAATLRVRKRLKEQTFGFSLDKFKVISDWYHLVILEICDLHDQIQFGEIARSLKLEVAVVKDAIKRLERLELLVMTEKGYKPTDQLSYFGDEQPSEGVNHFHSQVLQLIQNSLIEQPMSERKNQSLVFSGNFQEMKMMNEEIMKAVLNIVNKYAQTKSAKDCVQIFSMHSFPIYKSKAGDV